MEHYSNNEKETFLLGEEFGRAAKKGDVFCLNGQLGAGKTVFTKGLARGLGVDEPVTSPTFTFLNEYTGRIPLFHFDAYRLANAKESACFDFEEYFDEGVCVIEWAENVLNVVPESSFIIRIDRAETLETARKITVMRKASGKQ